MALPSAAIKNSPIILKKFSFGDQHNY